MSQSDCLNPVIREVEAAMQPPEAGQKQIVLDVERRRVVASGWSHLFGPMKYFMVSTNAEATCVVPVIYVIDNGDQGKAIGLKVTLAARCPEGNQENVVEALGAEANPTTAFVTKIREWSREYLSRQTAFFDSFSSARLQLE